MLTCAIARCEKPVSPLHNPCCSFEHYEVALVAGLIFQGGPGESDAGFRARIAARFEAHPEWKGG